MTLIAETTPDLLHQVFVVAVGTWDDDGNCPGLRYSVLSGATPFHANVVVATPEEAFALARDQIADQRDPEAWQIVSLLH